MALKPRYKRRIIWTGVSIFTITALAIIVVPPMITLDGIKPQIINAISEQTGQTAEISGDIHFSLLGRATIVAHDVTVPIGHIDSLIFTVPLSKIFNISGAEIGGNIAIYGANIKIDSLAAPDFGHNIDIYNSTVWFHNKNYEIVRAKLTDGTLSGTVRTDDHKYDLNFYDDQFVIRNYDNKLEINGQLFSDGTAAGTLEIRAPDINEWFDFSYPRINKVISLSMNFAWDGEYGFDFSNIKSDDFSGNIKLYPNGDRDIELKSDNMYFDFSFLTNPTKVSKRTTLDLDFYGKMQFMSYEFSHLRVNATADSDILQIANIMADDVAITGGTIDKDGAHNIMITMPVDGVPSMCLFYGTPQKWGCREFSYGNMHGSLSVDGDNFTVFVGSDTDMPSRDKLMHAAARLGRRGELNFQFKNIGGTYYIDNASTRASYTFANDKTLRWANPNFKFLPSFMLDARGNVAWNGKQFEFTPYTGDWKISMDDKTFRLTGTSFKALLPNMDLQSFNDFEYSISGTYSGTNISNMEIIIAGHKFTGTASGRNITLHTNVLNIDSFANQNYVDNYSDLEFLTAAPITIPFELPINISLSADAMIYNGNEFKNLVYALKSGVQTFSITDATRGNLLATFTKNDAHYDIYAQLNKFVIDGNLLSSAMPINIRDTMITGDINMTTNGHIAHDIYYNLAGDMDLSFDGGYIVGLGFDDFYASTDKITTFNAEYALAGALTGGETKIKKMHIIGKYENGNFITARPLTLQMRHVDAIGEFEITDGHMMALLNLTMRGTSPAPVPVRLSILPDGTRNYSFTEIMNNFDPSFLRDFVKTHNKF